MLYRYGTDNNGNLIKKAVVYTKSEHFISNKKIDPDALQIINRLRDAGYTAYVVGGAVRDLIVGNVPKDFDIVTDATPSKIKRIFRNSRIIGRRFRLVHVVFGSKIFENEGNFYRIQLWDLPGKDINQMVTKVHVKDAHGCIIGSDTNNFKTREE